MTKVLFLLSLVVMAVACFFSWQNRETFVGARKERQTIDRSIGAEYTKANAAANEVAAIKADVATVAGELESEKTRLEQAQIKMRNFKNETDRATADLDATNKEMAVVKSAFEKMPAGMTPETIGESINKQKTTIAENENKVTQIKEAIAAKEKEVKKAADDVADIQKRVEDRRKFYDRNSFSATIVAVNNDWGFVVIDAGKNKELTPETRLIVTRGYDSIAKLNIVSISNDRTVANIDRKSVRRGMSISPGDRVILETLYQ